MTPSPESPPEETAPAEPASDGGPLTIDQLRADLDACGLPGDTPVVLAKDAEGNGFSPLAEAEVAMYAEEDQLAEDDPDDYSEAPDGAVRALFLWPVN